MMENIPHATRDSFGTRGQCPNERIELPHKPFSLLHPWRLRRLATLTLTSRWSRILFFELSSLVWWAQDELESSGWVDQLEVSKYLCTCVCQTTHHETKYAAATSGYPPSNILYALWRSFKQVCTRVLGTWSTPKSICNTSTFQLFQEEPRPWFPEKQE